jgi:hypothetical protein
MWDVHQQFLEEEDVLTEDMALTKGVFVSCLFSLIDLPDKSLISSILDFNLHSDGLNWFSDL